MRLSNRDHAIAAAEARIRAAHVGEPQLLGAEHHSGREPMTESTERELRSIGATDEHIEFMKEIWNNRPARPSWRVNFLLRDPRYVDGITTAMVKIDEATGAAELEVFKRGGYGDAQKDRKGDI